MEKQQQAGVLGKIQVSFEEGANDAEIIAVFPSGRLIAPGISTAVAPMELRCHGDVTVQVDDPKGKRG